MSDVWKWELKMCCSLHVESLYKLLLQCQQQEITTGINLSPDYAAAPHDETLFDSVRLSLKSTEEGTLGLHGTVSYWSPGRGFWGYSTDIRTFETVNSCIEWLSDTHAASKKCAEVLSARCRD